MFFYFNLTKTRRNIFRPIVVCFSLMAFFSACKNGGESSALSGDYTVELNLKGANEHDTVILRSVLEGGKADTAVFTKDGTAQFQGKLEEPILASIFIMPKDESIPKYSIFFLEPCKINIKGTKENIDSAEVTGGPNNQSWAQSKAITQPFSKRMSAYNDSLKLLFDKSDTASFEAMRRKAMMVEDEEKTAVGKFIKDNPKSAVSAYYAYQLNGLDPDVNHSETLYGYLDKSIQGSYFGKKLKVSIDARKSTAIGAQAPLITANDLDGKPVELSSFKGKYVLVDFWASWCRPCREENPNVVAAYTSFKGKNFTILGVSLDEDKSAWKEAVAKDHLAWQQVSDLGGWQSAIAKQYSVESIPANFLLDPSGKIVAKDIRGVELAPTLAKFLK